MSRIRLHLSQEFEAGDAPTTTFINGRARYRPIDDRARYWANFFFFGRG